MLFNVGDIIKGNDTKNIYLIIEKEDKQYYTALVLLHVDHFQGTITSGRTFANCRKLY